jgi:hypothetical protein
MNQKSPLVSTALFWFIILDFCIRRTDAEPCRTGCVPMRQAGPSLTNRTVILPMRKRQRGDTMRIVTTAGFVCMLITASPTLADYGPYGNLPCNFPTNNPPAAPGTMSCMLGNTTWWVCTGNSGPGSGGTWGDTRVPCNRPPPPP